MSRLLLYPSALLSGFFFFGLLVHLSHFFHHQSIISSVSHHLCTPGLTVCLPPRFFFSLPLCPPTAQMISALSSHPIDLCRHITPPPPVSPTHSIISFPFLSPATTQTQTRFVRSLESSDRILCCAPPPFFFFFLFLYIWPHLKVKVSLFLWQPIISHHPLTIFVV